MGQDDVDKPLSELGWEDRLIDLPWEANRKVDSWFECVPICNNEFGIVFLNTDAPWLPGDLRKQIEFYIGP